MRSWSRRRTVVTVVAGLLVVWLIGVGWALLGARSHADAGAAELRSVRQRATIAALTAPSSRADLGEAQHDFDAAAARLDSPVLWPLRVVPVVSRHLRAADKLVTSAQDGSQAADDALRDLIALTKRSQAAGPQRVTTLRDLAAVAGRAHHALDAIDPGSPDALIGPLADAVSEMDAQRDDARQAAAGLQATSTALAGVLEGPDPYLLLGANNAEMRNGAGMFLSASEVRFDHGSMSLGDVRPTADLVLPKGSITATGELAANWPWLNPARDLRNLGLSADFPQSAALGVQNWARVDGGGPVAGTIVIDVDGIRSLLRVVGPVEVDGVRYTPDTVRGELLRRQYQRFDGDRDGRRDQLGAVARAIFERLEAGRWKLTDLATELTDAVQGRHLMVWSADPKVNAAWHHAGADGHLTDRSVSVALLNRSASKLDSWVDTAAAISTEAAGGGRRRITIVYDIDNRAPATGPQYQVGPNIDGIAAGDHRALAVVNLPAGSTEVAMDGAEVFLRGGDGPTVVIGGDLTVKRGTRARITVTALLPAGLDEITLEPSARIKPTAWAVEGEPLRTDRRRTVHLGG
ncbi:DUF4012 domain-containing protein [Aquihabitans sp. McL0605]|uniref:DUF4012 domain-containing protein n=1 Tax=Aquihabitans sp. McL0605 TaxID=3415671 RepID=UPI003CECDC56